MHYMSTDLIWSWCCEGVNVIRRHSPTNESKYQEKGISEPLRLYQLFNVAYSSQFPGKWKLRPTQKRKLNQEESCWLIRFRNILHAPVSCCAAGSAPARFRCCQLGNTSPSYFKLGEILPLLTQCNILNGIFYSSCNSICKITWIAASRARRNNGNRSR